MTDRADVFKDLGGTKSLLLTALWFLCCGPVLAQGTDPPYLSEFPTVERVLAEIEGRDKRDTDARHMGAFHHLRDMIERLSDGRNYKDLLTPDEKRLMTAYGEARGAIARRVQPALTQNDREDWFIALTKYETGDKYLAEVLDRFFPKDWAKAYVAEVFARDQDRRRAVEAQYGSGWTAVEFALPTAARNALLLQLLAAAVLLAFAFWRESRPFGVDANDPNLLRAGLWGRYRINTLTGRAANVKQWVTETRHARTDSDGQPDIRSRTERTTQFRIEAGERSMDIPEMKMYMSSLAEGAYVSVAWAARSGAARGDFLVVADHDLGSWHTFETIKGYFKAWLWPALPLAWLLVTMFRLSHYSEGSAAVMGSVILGVCMVMLGYYGWRTWITARRIARYEDTSGVALRERLQVESRAFQGARERKQQAIQARQVRRKEES